MRVRHVFALAALAFLLSACGADAITGPETRSPDGALYNGGWMGGPGAVARPTTDAESAA